MSLARLAFEPQIRVLHTRLDLTGDPKRSRLDLLVVPPDTAAATAGQAFDDASDRGALRQRSHDQHHSDDDGEHGRHVEQCAERLGFGSQRVQQTTQST